MNRVIHMNNIDVIATGLEEKLTEYAAKKPEDTEVIESRKNAIVRLREANIFILNLYSELEKEKDKKMSSLIEMDKLNAICLQLGKQNEEWERKYKGLIDFDNGK